MKTFLNNFLRDERGAVTVDWVVMTAAIVGLGVAVTVAVSPGMSQLAGKISDSVGSIELNIGGGGGEEAEEFSGIGPNPDKRGIEYTLDSFGPEGWVGAMAADAPAGYNFDTPLMSNGNELVGFDYPVYASNDGASYSINGQVFSVDQFDDGDFWTP